MRYKAFIFDLNGTIIDDMPFHTKGWYHILNDELGAGLSWEQVTAEMYGKNSEVLDRVFGKDRFTEAEKNAISIRKEQAYQEAFRPQLRLVKGLDDFLKAACNTGIKLAIGTAAIPFNVDFVVDNLDIRNYFKAIITADDVALSKPDPETFLKCAAALDIAPGECLVFEDVPKGAEAARNAGMDAVIITTGHQPSEFSGLNNIIGFVQDFADNSLQQLVRAAV